MFKQSFLKKIRKYFFQVGGNFCNVSGGNLLWRAGFWRAA